MQKKIIILGSTGSIGKATLSIIKKNKKDFKVVCLTAKNNYKLLAKQANEFNVKNIIIYNKSYSNLLKKNLKNKSIRILNKFENLNKFIKKKVDYTMCSIGGLSGLRPTLNAIKISKKVAIANKESIICGWSLILKELKKYKTNFLPIDSEHYAIWNLTKNCTNEEIDEIIITASGGPFLKKPLNKINNALPHEAIKHPKWKMGKKISIDSATLMNKVFEIIEAYKIFNYDLKKFKILIHPQSYVHSIIKFKNGLVKILLHDTDMRIPISNSIYDERNLKIKSNNIDYRFLNKLNFIKVSKKRFPAIKFIKNIPNKDSLYESVIVSANDELVNLFLKKKIRFNEIIYYLNKIINNKKFKKYRNIKPSSIRDIMDVYNLVRLKTQSISV